MRSKVTLAFAVYDNGGMLEEHLKTWSDWSDHARDRIDVLIVDDASPNTPALPIISRAQDSMKALPRIKLFRVLENIPWNQNGARNLAMMQTEGEWHLLTDADHLLRAEQAENLLAMNAKGGKFYVPQRRKLIDGRDRPYHRHPNSYLLTREAFWDAGGYDEDFCGYYGSDSTFRRQLEFARRRVETDEFYLALYGREVIADASTTEFGRKDSKFHVSNNPALVAKKKYGVKATNHVRFKWERQL